MPNYRLLVFRSHRLERWQEFEADNHVEAVQKAGDQLGENDGLVELWSSDCKIAVWRPPPTVGRR